MNSYAKTGCSKAAFIRVKSPSILNDLGYQTSNYCQLWHFAGQQQIIFTIIQPSYGALAFLHAAHRGFHGSSAWLSLICFSFSPINLATEIEYMQHSCSEKNASEMGECLSYILPVLLNVT